MFFILVLLALAPSVCGLTELQTAEGANVTLQWDSPGSIDPSSLILCCFRTTSPPVKILEVVEGKQWPSSTGRQFSGRVRWDREALKVGRVRIDISGVSAQDQGLYWCYMFSNHQHGRWEHKSEANQRFQTKTSCKRCWKKAQKRPFLARKSTSADSCSCLTLSRCCASTSVLGSAHVTSGNAVWLVSRSRLNVLVVTLERDESQSDAPRHAKDELSAQVSSDLGAVQKTILCLMFGFMTLTASCITVTWAVLHLRRTRIKETLLHV